MDHLLILNSGSSSIKFALLTQEVEPVRLLSGIVERIGSPQAMQESTDHLNGKTNRHAVDVIDHASALRQILSVIEGRKDGDIAAVGHRIVLGGKYKEPQLLTQTVLQELETLASIAPEHMPHELALVRIVAETMPAIPQFACFDTAFHANLPQMARLVPLPRELTERLGIRRYGFHGLSYAFLLEELRRIAGEKAANGRLIFLHLGNGASMAAVSEGVCKDTTMGFTPTGGLMMSTRSGDLDPGILWHVLKSGDSDPDALYTVLNRESGLLGVSGLSSDMRDLLAAQKENKEAADAVELFCYLAKKFLGALAAVIGGVDTVIFTGGIGENSPEIRSRICNGLDYLGIAIDADRNEKGEAVISSEESPVTVRMMHTDEELMIARAAANLVPSSSLPS